MTIDHLPSTPVSRARMAGHILVECLLAQGVDTVFGVPGESYLAVLDGLYEHRDRIRFVACRHEGGAAFMAEAHGKLTGRPGVCMVTRGPGATNASIGLHTAFQDSTPLILLVGQVASDQRDREAFQEMDYRHMFGPGTLGLAKWVAEVHSAERLPEYMARAYRTAMQGRPGPVVLALPEDMLTTPTTAFPCPRVEPAQVWPAPQELQRARELLAAAQRPLVIVGGGGWTGESTRALQQFAEAWHLPVGCGFRFQDTFDNAHPLYAGDVGISINPKLAQRIRQADCILAVGVRLGEMTTSGYTLLEVPRPSQRLIHLHAGAEELGRVYQADISLQASLAQAGHLLASLAPPAVLPWKDWTEQAHADYLGNLLAEERNPMDLAAVIKTMQRLAPADTVFTNGAGNAIGWLNRYVRYPALHHHGRTQLGCTSGAMGYGFPAAVAAALVQPHRTVVNVAGDGDFLMTGQEMATAKAEGARQLICVVVDNGSYGTIRMHQEREYPGRVSGSELKNPDFAAMARAFGWRASTVNTTAEFEPEFSQALAAGEPWLIHLKLPVDVITTRTTLQAIRQSALAAGR